MKELCQELTHSLLDFLNAAEFEIRSESYGYSHEFEFKSEFNVFITLWESEKLFKMNYEIEGKCNSDLSIYENTIKRILTILNIYGYKMKDEL